MHRHPFDLVSLLFGAVFAFLGAAALLTDVRLLRMLTVFDLRWLGPLVVLALGLWLLLSAGLSGRGGRAREDGEVG